MSVSSINGEGHLDNPDDRSRLFRQGEWRGNGITLKRLDVITPEMLQWAERPEEFYPHTDVFPPLPTNFVPELFSSESLGTVIGGIARYSQTQQDLDIVATPVVASVEIGGHSIPWYAGLMTDINFLNDIDVQDLRMDSTQILGPQLVSFDHAIKDFAEKHGWVYTDSRGNVYPIANLFRLQAVNNLQALSMFCRDFDIDGTGIVLPVTPNNHLYRYVSQAGLPHAVFLPGKSAENDTVTMRKSLLFIPNKDGAGTKGILPFERDDSVPYRIGNPYDVENNRGGCYPLALVSEHCFAVAAIWDEAWQQIPEEKRLAGKSERDTCRDAIITQIILPSYLEQK